MPDLAGFFGDLTRLGAELAAVVDQRMLADCDLPLTWFEPMQVIARHGRCRVIDIAEALSMTMSGVSKLVDRIEASGLCRRRPHPDDRRSSLIELTPAGRRRLAEADRSLREELALRIGATVPASALEQLGTAVAALRGALRAPAEARPDELTG